MVKVTTSIKIDDEKRELAKRKGLILTDILDKALDFYLGIELKESTQLQQDKEEILNNLEVLEIEKDKFLKDHENKLQSLEDDKQTYLNNYETQKMELNYTLKNIEDSLASAIIEDKEKTKEKEYKILANMVYDEGDLYRNPDILQVVNAYADKYEMSKTEFEELEARLIDDLTNLFTDGRYKVKGTLKCDIMTGRLIYEK